MVEESRVIFMVEKIRREVVLFLLALVFSLCIICPGFQSVAKGATYEAHEDVYYTKDNCVVYAEPTYTSMVLTTLGANIPVQVVGQYSNGWYRINIGVIAYIKMDSVASAGAIGLPIAADKQIADAQKTSQELGYQFVNLNLNKQKKINKDVFNSYINQKVILYCKINDELGVSFKMLYADKVRDDISLNFSKSESITPSGERAVKFEIEQYTPLFGQVAIFQFRAGYDKEVEISNVDMTDDELVFMNTYCTEFSEFAYATCTQVADMKFLEYETIHSLTDKQRERMANIRKGIKYLDYDTKDYRNSIHNKVRKDTEYIDYYY